MATLPRAKTRTPLLEKLITDKGQPAPLTQDVLIDLLQACQMGYVSCRFLAKHIIKAGVIDHVES